VSTVTRRQILLVAILVVACSGVSAWLGYRRAFHRPASSSAVCASAIGRCVDFHDAQSRLGQTACVSGRVLRVFTSRAGNTFLDFCADFRACPFSSVIFYSDRSKFGDLDTLGGRQVEIQGLVASYQGRAEIILRDPRQVRVLP